MKFPNFVEFFRFHLKEMGIKDLLGEIDIQLSKAEGIEIDISDPYVAKFNDGIFYRGRRVLVYIRDQYISYLEREGEGYKFHICYCGKLRDMERKHRFESRYVATTNTSGEFIVNLIDHNGYVLRKGERIKMRVCKICLSQLDYKGYSGSNPDKKQSIYENFDIKEFFDQYRNFRGKTPKRDEFDFELNIYPSNWDYISQNYRDKVGWKCEECSVDLSDPDLRKYLDVHHKDGNKANNNESNLVALCVKCHSNKPFHGRMKLEPRYKEFQIKRSLIYSSESRDLTFESRNFKVGEIVQHYRFGTGQIVQLKGHGAKARITVDFGGEVKTFLAEKANLRKVDTLF